jgi:hypothetical protein
MALNESAGLNLALKKIPIKTWKLPFFITKI